MRVGVPGEFHEERWQRTAEDSERCMLPRTREAGPIEYKLSRGEGVFRPLFGTATLPTGTPEPSSRGEGKEIGAVDGIKVGFRTGFGTGTMRTSTPEAFPRGEGDIYRPFGTGTLNRTLLGQGHVASLSGTGVKPVSFRCLGRTSARHPRREASRWHPGVAKQSSIGSSSIKCRYSMDIEVRIGFLSMKCRCFMDGCLGLDWAFA